MEFVFWPEVFDSVHILTKSMNTKGFRLDVATHFFVSNEKKALHYPSLVLRFVNDQSTFVIYNVNLQGNYSYVSTYTELNVRKIHKPTTIDTA
jgi:hypothetical protein